MNRSNKLLRAAALAAALSLPLAPTLATAVDAPNDAAPSGAPCPGAGPGCCGGRGPGGTRGWGGRGARAFDPAAVTTVKGRVAALRTVEGRRGAGVHADLTVGAETYDVHLGPAGWLDQQPLELSQGDEVEVKGARLQRAGTPVIVAQEIRRGGDVLTLRDAQGVPRWAGR